MIDIIVAVIATVDVLFIFLAAIGFLRMPDAYLRMCVTTKASTLGTGLILLSAAVFFHESGVIPRVVAIILFLFLTVPVGAHLIARVSYFIGVKLWKGTVMDELEGKYDRRSHELHSKNETGK